MNKIVKQQAENQRIFMNFSMSVCCIGAEGSMSLVDFGVVTIPNSYKTNLLFKISKKLKQSASLFFFFSKLKIFNKIIVSG